MTIAFHGWNFCGKQMFSDGVFSDDIDGVKKLLRRNHNLEAMRSCLLAQSF
jgi:hypothetical protein